MKNRSRRLALEQLEGRDLCAGNVTITTENGTTYVRGDNASNFIRVQKLRSASGVTRLEFNHNISQPSQTTFNGDTKPVIVKVKGMVVFDLGAGNDRLLIENDRNDVTGRYITSDVDVHFPASISIDAGAGHDRLKLAVNVLSGMPIDAGSGNDIVRLHGIVYGPKLTMNPPDLDSPTTKDMVVLEGVQSSTIVVMSGNGNDTVQVTAGTDIRRRSRFELGEGTNRFSTSTATRKGLNERREPKFHAPILYRGSKLDTLTFSTGEFLSNVHVSPASIPFSTAKQRTLSPAEVDAVEHSLTRIRNSQLPDGNLAVVYEPSLAEKEIRPYFNGYAALALGVSADLLGNKADLQRLHDYLQWLALNQDIEGVWHDQLYNNGEYSPSTRVPDIDAYDSLAALYLLNLGRYYHAGGRQVSAEMKLAAVKCLDLLNEYQRPDGLLRGVPTNNAYSVFAYFLDNIEDTAGLRAGAQFFAAIGDLVHANLATSLADRIDAALPSFYDPTLGRYAYAKDDNGVYSYGGAPGDAGITLNESNATAQAQYFGIAFVGPQSDAWQYANDHWSTDDGNQSGAVFSEYLLLAALRTGTVEANQWRDNVIAALPTLDSTGAYSSRYGQIVMALLEGDNFLPGVAATTFNNRAQL